MNVPAYGYSVPSADTHGLDPRVFRVMIGVHRRDGEALTDEQVAAIKAALAPLVDTSETRPDAAPGHQP